MPKTVKQLKDKHRDRAWVDSEGYVIFYSLPLNSWAMLTKSTAGRGSAVIPLGDGEVDAFFGPFKEIAR